MNIFLPDIPRLYTGLAESFACLLYVIWYSKGRKNKNGLTIAVIMGVGQMILQYIAGSLPIDFWLFGMLVNLIWMFLTIYVSTPLSINFSIYTSLKAFVLAEFIASFVWQIYTFFMWERFQISTWTLTIFVTIFYIILLSIVFYLETKYTLVEMIGNIDKNENITIGFITSIIFITSNIGFILESTDYNLGNSFAIYSMRTLANFNGICVIFLLQTQKHDRFLKDEIEKINNVFGGRQYQKYIDYKENHEIIKQKLHDLKHQVYIIKSEENLAKKNEKIDNVLEEIKSMNAEIQTGNVVLDTILTSKNIYCIEQKIVFTCFVDGKILEFMDVLDICNLFGNALDNAIEFVEKQESIEKRLINLRVCEKNKFIIIRFDNYCEQAPTFINGLPMTTKKDTANHGYGLKSIKYTTEKYNGNMTISYEENWFTVKILFPVIAIS